MNERDIFNAARRIKAADERTAYLDTVCGGDADVRRRIEELLFAHDQVGGFLEDPCVDRPETIANDGHGGPQPGGPRTQSDIGDSNLDFLSGSQTPGVLGRIGAYEVTEVIGRGGMGIVLKARDARLNRVVAVKVLAPELAGNAMARRRFVREAQSVAAVAHPHIVAIYSVDEDRLPYLVMEFVDGPSLQEKIDREGHLQLREILRIGAQIAAGLAAAHAHGVIHRDIKPANILLENGVERVRITDFGLARAVDDVAVTRTGEVTGTPQYMSPEQTQGQSVDARSDLFSLGSVLYAMCTGRSPFRADTTMACLRRVSDDTPRPIREVNSDVPTWLVAIIDRLLEKEPADRFQTASEVAELLGKHLAHTQNPGSTPFPGMVRPIRRPARPAAPWRRRGLVAALILIALAAGFGVTEGTGVTEFSATVVRIVTGEGTLAIEVDDPTVQVSLNGEELSITGAGLKEITLRPGQYQFEAVKNGQPVKRELVTISRGGKQVVRVTREAAADMAAPAGAAKFETPRAERQAFVVLGTKGVVDERKFDTLAEAVLGTGDGDTIEVRGNGPFVTGPIDTSTSLAIRAGEGFRPVIKADPDEPEKYLLRSNAPLVLEGLDLQWVDAKAHDPTDLMDCHLISSAGPDAKLFCANCRFLMNRREGPHRGMGCIGAWRMPLCRIVNCQFLGAGHGSLKGIALHYTEVLHGQLELKNCECIATAVHINLPSSGSVKVVLDRNTVLGWAPLKLILAEGIEPPALENGSRPLQVKTLESILGGPILAFQQPYAVLAAGKALSAAEAEQLVASLTVWREDRNLYSFPDNTDLLRLVTMPEPQGTASLQLTAPIRTLADWKRFWGTQEIHSEHGRARFQGGDLLAKAKLSPELIASDDFRLRPDSPGYQTGEGGRDLGADVDLVGPGAAYERWRTTPEYQQWRIDSGQTND